jgi:ring-1,2-phenylacetyl-CoA epoxidase subunit PaaB
MIFEVFRQAKRKDYHVHVGNVHAPDREMAQQFAQVMHARRKPANSLWVVPKDEITEVDADDERVAMGGLTQKQYRWATNYNTDETFAEEIEDSQREQEAASETREASEETRSETASDGGREAAGER